MPKERNRVEIDLDNFAHNINRLKEFIPAGRHLMQIVKADAYGHGAYEIAKKSIELGITYLGTANVEEGILLRSQNITAPILILSPCFVEEIDLIKEYSLTPAISSYDFAEKLNQSAQSRINVHIEVDTGMGRTGFHYKDALAEIKRIEKLAKINIEGVFSHYSSSETDAEFTLIQNKRFNDIISAYGQDAILPKHPPKYIHISNSAGLITNHLLCKPVRTESAPCLCTTDGSDVTEQSLPLRLLSAARSCSKQTNMVRLGLLSYGIYPDPSFKKLINLKQVMYFKSTVCSIKKAYRDETIGYNKTFIAERDTKYAIIPVGYADGYDFLLSNNAFIEIKGKLYPVIGKVSMDMITVDITDSPDISVGDEVTLLGDDSLRAENVAGRYNGLSYELVSQIGRRAKRYYRENGEIVSTSPLARRGFVSSDFDDNKLNLIIESAISQRLQSREISTLLYGEILKRFFSDKDRDIHYRKKFTHNVTFELPKPDPSFPSSPQRTDRTSRLSPDPQCTDRKPSLSTDPQCTDRKPSLSSSPSFPSSTPSFPRKRESTVTRSDDYFEVSTRLSFTKILQQDYFLVACATNSKNLEHYFKRKDVEYRWLLDSSFTITEDYFRITDVRVNKLKLSVASNINPKHKCLEVKCTHPGLNSLVGKEVRFSISTKTYYPRKSNQLTIYITELTKGVKVSFKYPENALQNVDSVAIFSGQNKYPGIVKQASDTIEVTSKPDEWVFPNSGIVFTYHHS